MRGLTGIFVFVFSILLAFPSYSKEKDSDICKITIDTKRNQSINREFIYNFSKDKPIFMCPFSLGGIMTYFEEPCSRDGLEKIGKYSIENIERDNLYKEVSKCTPLMGVRDRSYDYKDPVKSYLFYNSSQKFMPGVVRDEDDLFYHQLKQFLNEIAAPIVYYNGMSNAICMSVRQSEEFSIEEMIKQFGFKVPSGVLIESSNLNCKSWFMDRFHVSLSEPVLN